MLVYDTFLGFDDIISRDVFSSLTSSHYLFSRGVFVLGFQILTRHRLVPWKSSWHIVRRAVPSPAREKHAVRIPKKKNNYWNESRWVCVFPVIQHLSIKPLNWLRIQWFYTSLKSAVIWSYMCFTWWVHSTAAGKERNTLTYTHTISMQSYTGDKLMGKRINRWQISLIWCKQLRF